jgi:PKD repeat protein
VLLALAAGCGRGGGPATAAGVHHADPAAFAALLPAPADLRAAPGRHAAGAQDWQRSGAQYDPALPPQRATVQNTALAFTPDWTAESPLASGLAFALYRFNVAGYGGEQSLRFTWSQPQDAGDLYVALPDFPHNRWVFLPGPADGILPLSTQQFADATDPGTQDFLAVPLLTGAATWELALLRIGPAPQSSIAISGVTPSSQRAFSHATFFPAYSGGEAQSWSWDFGGGAVPGTAVGKTPAVSLAGKGEYSASVTAVDHDGIPATYYFTLSIKALGDLPPHIYGVQPNSGDTGQQVNIATHNDGGTPDSWAWDFGGGATPNAPTGNSPLVTLGAPGQYAASVTTTNANGSHTFNFTLFVTTAGGLKPPNLLGVTPAGGNSGAQATYSLNNPGGTPDSWAWDFGGGATPGTSTAANPHVTFATAGIYDGTVTASNSAGSATWPFKLYVTELAAPHLTGVTPTSVLPNAPQGFSAANNGGSAATWSWDFGGAGTPNTSTSSLPQVQIGAKGVYDCSVTATNAAGSDTLEFTLTVADLTAPELTAVTPLSGYLYDSAAFSATNSGGAADTWAWDFGGACTPGTSSSQTPHVQLTAQGSFDCSVTAANAAGDMTYHFTLNVGAVRPPFIASAGPATAESTAMVQFSAHNTGGQVDTWAWDFGGGCSPGTSAAEQPLVQAGAVGQYNGSVTATNASGSHTFNFTLTVSALEAPVIDSISPGIAETGSAVVFFPSLSGGPPDTYSWDFGGACTPNTSSLASPSVTTGAIGSYTVTLTVSNSAGSDSKTFPLNIVPFAG